MILIEDKAHCLLEYDPDMKCVIQTWRGFSGSKNFRASILKTIEVFQEYDAESIISDTQNSEVVKQSDADWTANHANPILMEHGLRKIAFIVPKSVVAQWSVDRFMEEAEKQQLSVQYFDNLAEAKAWVAGSA